MRLETLFLGHKPEKMKSNTFTQTCSRFSQFLKERRSLGQLDAFNSIASSELEIKGVKEVSGPKMTSINLFQENMEKEKMSLELFPLMNSTKDNMADSRELPISKEEPKNCTTSPSMTIFYGGKVLVFNELPEDKAREIMSLANRGTLSSGSQTINTAVTTHVTRGAAPPQASSLSGLPITRRVSLHRFMEKRKHRIAANAPYQLHNSPMVTMADSHPQKYSMMKSLSDQQQLELKL